MENTLENKVRFFALYWGFKCLRNELLSDNIPAHKVDTSNCKGLPQQYLELTPLSQISDEDAIICAKLIYKYDDTPSGKIASERSHTAENGKDYVIESIQDNDGVFHSVVSFEVVDYLRSRGYALPFMGLSVEELVIRGWVKLKGETK